MLTRAGQLWDRALSSDGVSVLPRALTTGVYHDFSAALTPLTEIISASTPQNTIYYENAPQPELMPAIKRLLEPVIVQRLKFLHSFAHMRAFGVPWLCSSVYAGCISFSSATAGCSKPVAWGSWPRPSRAVAGRSLTLPLLERSSIPLRVRVSGE